MPGIGIGELVVIFLLLLVFVGPARLPQVARIFGKVMGEVRRATDELKNSLYLEDVRQRKTPPANTPRTRPRTGDGVPRPRKSTVREVELPDEGPPADTDPAEDARLAAGGKLSESDDTPEADG